MPELLPVIPTDITVHLGPANSAARNVTVPFVDYVKNVASSEIYPTWPENALRANIYAIISFALNRVYNEYYRTRGYDFDITNTTAIDQAYTENGEVFENISRIVDEIFNDYIVRQGSIEPLAAKFCNGTTSTCAGLSQWGTVDLANQGLTPFAILTRYYGDDIRIVENAPVEDISESYPGAELQLGDASNAVKTIQTELNRISRNYPAIPKIAREDGIFGPDTEAAVREFQEIFNLSPTGRVDKATWYRIKQYFSGVKSLSELRSEGLTLGEVRVPFALRLGVGSTGFEVRSLQYYLNVIAYFNPQFNTIPINGIYDETTANAVRQFQTYYGLNPTGETDVATWELLNDIYISSVASLPEGYSGNLAKIYPGYFLTEGMSGQNITDLQTYLSRIAEVIPSIPTVSVTGYFGSQTRNSVETFQELFGINPTGSVGPLTWYTIAREYDNIVSS